MKRFLSIVLSLMLSLSLLATSVNADSETGDFIEVQDQLLQLEEKYEFEKIDIKNIPENDIVKFDSIEELEEFIIGLQEELDEMNEITQEINVSNQLRGFSDVNLQSVYNGSRVINWWAPFSGWGMTGLACWRNVSFDYKYKFVGGNPRFTSLNNIDSYLTGINVTWWEQKTRHHNFTTTNNYNDTAELDVKGNFVLGVVVKDFAIGLRIPGHWTPSLRLE